MDTDAIAIKLRRARLKRGWIMDVLAAESGVDKGTISRLERGRSPRPSVASLVALGRALGMEEGELVILKPNPAGLGTFVSDRRMALFRAIGAEDAEEPDVSPVPDAAASPSRRILPNLDYQPAVRGDHKGRYKRVRVRGKCLHPKIQEGDFVYFDALGEVDVGVIVVAYVDGSLHVKRLRGRSDDDGYELAPDNGEPAIPVDPETHIAGAYIGVWRQAL